jgi:hypothetical protein
MLDEIQTDLLVVGGGLAGCLAAIAVKRTNPEADVWLVEQYGFLGGMATTGYVYPFMGYSARVPKSKVRKRLTGGLFKELVDRMHTAGYTEKRAPSGDFFGRFDPMLLRCILDTMVLDAGVQVLFHGIVNVVETTRISPENRKITEITVQTKRGPIKFTPRVVIDGSGDADVAFHAGAEYALGREKDHLTQPATLMFRIAHVGALAPIWGGMSKRIREEKRLGNSLTPRDDCLLFMGIDHRERHFNQTRVAGFDFTDPFDMTKAEIEGRTQAERFIRFLRSKVRGYHRSTVASIGTQLGIRETRRIIGEYILTEEDLVQCKQFPDRIALGNYPVDIHDPQGSATTAIRRIPDGKFYSIPYRSLVPKRMQNLLITGRPISATHEAHAAIRIMPICSSLGHAAGCAAGILLKEKESLAFKDINIENLQNILRAQGAILD